MKSIGLISVQFSQSHLVAVVVGQRVPEQDEPVQQPDGVALSQRASRSLRQLRPTKFRSLLPGKIANQVQTLESTFEFCFFITLPFSKCCNNLMKDLCPYFNSSQLSPNLSLLLPVLLHHHGDLQGGRAEGDAEVGLRGPLHLPRPRRAPQDPRPRALLGSQRHWQVKIKSRLLHCRPSGCFPSFVKWFLRVPQLLCSFPVAQASKGNSHKMDYKTCETTWW